MNEARSRVRSSRSRRRDKVPASQNRGRWPGERMHRTDRKDGRGTYPRAPTNRGGDRELDEHDQRAYGVIGDDRWQLEDGAKHELSVANAGFQQISPPQNPGSVISSRRRDAATSESADSRALVRRIFCVGRELSRFNHAALAAKPPTQKPDDTSKLYVVTLRSIACGSPSCYADRRRCPR